MKTLDCNICHETDPKSFTGRDKWRCNKCRNLDMEGIATMDLVSQQAAINELWVVADTKDLEVNL